MSARIRCGDVVLHRPSGERWVVAYADYDRGTVSACGWPESIAWLSDCELTDACTDEEHEHNIDAWLTSPPRRDQGSPDHRVAAVRRLYRQGAQ